MRVSHWIVSLAALVSLGAGCGPGEDDPPPGTPGLDMGVETPDEAPDLPDAAPDLADEGPQVPADLGPAVDLPPSPGELDLFRDLGRDRCVGELPEITGLALEPSTVALADLGQVTVTVTVTATCFGEPITAIDLFSSSPTLYAPSSMAVTVEGEALVAAGIETGWMTALGEGEHAMGVSVTGAAEQLAEANLATLTITP